MSRNAAPTRLPAVSRWTVATPSRRCTGPSTRRRLCLRRRRTPRRARAALWSATAWRSSGPNGGADGGAATSARDATDDAQAQTPGDEQRGSSSAWSASRPAAPAAAAARSAGCRRGRGRPATSTSRRHQPNVPSSARGEVSRLHAAARDRLRRRLDESARMRSPSGTSRRGRLVGGVEPTPDCDSVSGNGIADPAIARDALPPNADAPTTTATYDQDEREILSATEPGRAGAALQQHRRLRLGSVSCAGRELSGRAGGPGLFVGSRRSSGPAGPPIRGFLQRRCARAPAYRVDRLHLSERMAQRARRMRPVSMRRWSPSIRQRVTAADDAERERRERNEMGQAGIDCARNVGRRR